MNKQCEKIERIYEIIEILNNENIDCGEWYRDYYDLIDILNEYITILKIDCDGK